MSKSGFCAQNIPLYTTSLILPSTYAGYTSSITYSGFPVVYCTSNLTFIGILCLDKRLSKFKVKKCSQKYCAFLADECRLSQKLLF